MTVGATRPELHVELYSGNHPFYTGQQRLVDTEGQVDRFMKRLQRRENIQEEVEQIAEDVTQSPLAASIDDLGLSSRAINAMKKAGLETIGDVKGQLAQGDDALLSIVGVGQKALIDVKKFMRAQGLIS